MTGPVPRRALRHADESEGHFEHFDGGWTVGIEAYSQDADVAPFFKGLPNDECAGHTPILYAGTEVVEFSPSEELGRTMEVVTKNMEEMEASA